MFDTQQESEALVVQGLLQSAGIEAELTSHGCGTGYFSWSWRYHLLVREEDAAVAKRLIAGVSGISDDDSDVNAGPAA